MKTYRVHFSFYSEETGEFDESYYSVQAENCFQARRTAWLMYDRDDNARFRSCVKQCGVTWDPSPLDLCDYLNAAAAYDKYMLKYIDDVKLPNAEITQDSNAKRCAERDRLFHYGSLDAVCRIACDIGKPFGMEPPDICEEAVYALELVGKLDESGKHAKAQSLADTIDHAKAWDRSAALCLRDLFIDGYIYLDGDAEHFFEYFGRDGVFPEKADIKDTRDTYVSRWSRAPVIDQLLVLRPFDERHVIAGSGLYMDYSYWPLVLKADRLDEGSQTPENLLWMPLAGEKETGIDSVSTFVAENLITGERVEWCRGDFYGVLRPEYYANIEMDALKKEYASRL
jgi:hypothetical protein